MGDRAVLRVVVLRVLAWGMALFQLYTAGFGSYDALIQRGVHLGFAMALILLMFPTRPLGEGKSGRLLAAGVTIILTLAALVPLAYIFLNYDYLAGERMPFITPLTPLEMGMGIALIMAVLELCRRVTGVALPAIVLVFLIYPFIPNLPGILGHAGYDLGIQIDIQYLTTSGIFGIPLGASANYIALFVIFGAFLEKSGLGPFIMEFATGLVGRYRGGPAKVAVIASALTGTITGSAPANVLTVGAVTIPMMKRLGYPPYMAGAIEAAASTGGVLMPPVMGSVAFIMAQFLGVPYQVVALYALIPALLYFFGVFCSVHFAAVRFDVKGLAQSEIPDWRRSFRTRGHLLLPVVILVVLMVMDYSPQFCAFYAILSVIAVSWLRRSTRMDVKSILEAFELGAKGVVLVAIATAAAGMIVGVFELTTVGLKLAQSATSLAGTLLAGLVLTMVVSILLGAGVPPSVAYIVQVAVTIPMLQGFLQVEGMDSKIAVIIAHFFVMYYSSLAVLTPPDALAAVAASGIAGSPFLKTSLHATRVAFVAFIVPFLFVYRPALLTLGSPLEIAMALGVAVLGVFILAVAFEGVWRRPLTLWERALAFASGLILIFPTRLWDVAGLGLLLLLGVLQWVRPIAAVPRARD